MYLDEEHETFRNELASVNKDGKRKWVYARKPAGRYFRLRTILSWFLLAFLFAAPFVKVGGQQLVLLNFLERRFVLLGVVFWPQDFYLVVVIALTLLVTLALSTTAVGRIWCGWLCPQTIFMEMLFRKIEWAIDGSAAQQVRRHRGPWNVDRIWRTVVKQGIFFALSFLIANVFLAYIVGSDQLIAIVTAPPGEHYRGLVAITIFSLVFYGVFSRFREQACTLACPYGRVMSALQDAHTITVTYDKYRGEPRGHAKAAAAEHAYGDCIDCGQCVTVCPTGIDIRNGIQLECVNCTACIDSCDEVMTRLQRPTGLIRLTSHEALKSGKVDWLTTRVKAYGTVWTLLVIVAITLFVIRPDMSVLILRQPGTLYTEMENGAVANFYNVQVINRTGQTRSLEYVASAPAGATIIALGPIGSIDAHQVLESRFLLQLPEGSLGGASTPVRIEVRSDGKLFQTIDSSFLGPAKKENRP
ncbi:MAG: cytochrome c oxidase accessory protein CcoG [Acidobacteriota bacterium]